MGSPGSSAQRIRTKLGPWTFPLVVALFVVVLSALNLQGSSVAIYASENGSTKSEAGVIAGEPRPIRSDEWLVRTPWVMSQAHNGFPGTLLGGVGGHDAAVLSALPTAGWEVVLRPESLPYLLFGGERGLSIEWWLSAGLQILGIYALVFAITRSEMLGVACGLLMLLSPVTQWWTGPTAYNVIGYGSLAAALVIWAMRAEANRRRLSLAVLAGMSSSAFLVALYPPWQIGVALVLVPVTLGALWSEFGAATARRTSLRRFAVIAAVSGIVAVGLFGSFAVVHRSAFSGIANTVYPGGRAAEVGGTASPENTLSSPFDLFARDPDLKVVNGTNQSENASGLLLVLPVGAVLIVLLRTRAGRAEPALRPLIGAVAAAVVMVAWMFLPLPAWAGYPLLLHRVPGSRLALPLAFAGVISFGLLLHVLKRPGITLSRWTRVAASALFLIVEGAAAVQYRADGAPIGKKVWLAILLVVAFGLFLSLGSRPGRGLAVLLGFSLVVAALINPIQRGTDALTNNELSRAIDRVRVGRPKSAGWVMLTGSPFARGIVTATGVNHLTSASPYPDVDSWLVLDPRREHEEVWNRYATVSFELGPKGSDPVFTLVTPDGFSVEVDPCDPRLERLGVDLFITENQVAQECATFIQEARLGASLFRIYERTGPDS